MSRQTVRHSLDAALAILLLLFPVILPAQEIPADSTELLHWVHEQATAIEKTLRYATISQYGPDLTRRLEEAEEKFKVISYSRLRCEEAVRSAQRGLKLCNLLDSKSDGDINALIERATKVRIEAINMQDAVGFCLEAITPITKQPDLTSAEIFTSSVKIARKDINYGLRSGDNLILAFDLDHAIHVLTDAEQMASVFDGCLAFRQAAQKAVQACTAALLSSTWVEIEKNCLTALVHLDTMEAEAKCR